MRRLLIVAASGIALLAIGFGAEVALRDEASTTEPRVQHRATQIWMDPTTVTCGTPPYKPCAGASSGSVQVEIVPARG